MRRNETKKASSEPGILNLAPDDDERHIINIRGDSKEIDRESRSESEWCAADDDNDNDDDDLGVNLNWIAWTSRNPEAASLELEP